MSIRTKIDFSGITSDNIVTSDNKKYIHEDDEIFNSLKDEIAACENAQVQTEIATLEILDIKEQTKVIANEAIDTATERAESAENAQALAETAAINALEAERNVTEFSDTFAKLDEDNTFTGNNNFTGTLKLDNQNIVAEQIPITKGIWANVGGSPVIVYNDNTERGSALYLFGKSNNDFKGGFILRALATDDTYKDLRGFNDGTLTWNQKNIITSDYMSNINWDSDMTTDPYIGINNSKIAGPFIYFRRGNGTTNPGALELVSRGSDNICKTLILKPDGTITWNGKNIITNDIPFGFPDYTSAVRMEYESAQEYIAPDNGWVGVDVNGAFNDDIIMITLSIDGRRVHTIPKGFCNTFIIPIAKNSIFKGVTYSNSGTIEAIGHLDWFPAKK